MKNYILENAEEGTRWYPSVDGLLEQYYLTRIDDKIDTLNVFLVDKKIQQKIKVCFYTTWAYRNFYETLAQAYGKAFCSNLPLIPSFYHWRTILSLFHGT